MRTHERPPLVPQVAEVALNVQPFEHNARAAAKASNPNRRRKWLIPLVLVAQVGGAQRRAARTCSMLCACSVPRLRHLRAR